VKSFSVLALCVFISVLAGCTGANQHQANIKPVRAPSPLSKGVELYSLKPTGEDWHFSLLAGTNRNKSLSEVTDPARTVVGIEALKQRLATLAVREWVTWLPMGTDKLGHPAWDATRADAPPREMVDGVVRYCKSLQITLNAYPCSRLAAPSH